MDDDYWKNHQHPTAPAFRQSFSGSGWSMRPGHPEVRQPLLAGDPISWNALRTVTPSLGDYPFRLYKEDD